ncbi:hypothetical protein KIH74_10920 [Kineosporia sp. J2-2]|uniref:Uncharacterized protein n=1 Tax=Kineosporia corallincola TaxID=2835133 RepID=A0ABS5TIN0_9ACTN|nr:hypothetical protein [Kineosporia corallincola]MBT0769434.1 hypothetical protein [Kineosporia corallincola]
MTNDLISQVVAELTAAADRPAAFAEFTSGLRDHLRRRHPAQQALDDVLHRPMDTRARAALIALLHESVSSDADFRTWLESAWNTHRPDHDDTGRTTTNTVHGNVGGHAVQARDIHGGIRFE